MSKTPISALQEYMQKGAHGTPVYTLIGQSSPTDSPSFTFRVNCCGLNADGIGTTKKEAKHNAAREMLKRVINGDSDSQLSQLSRELSEAKYSHADFLRPKSVERSVINSVGKLNEFCAAHRLKPPEYTEMGASGPSHMMVFKIKCTVGSMSTDGSANTKKQAKHEAAQNMYQLLVTTPKFRSGLESNLPNGLKNFDEKAEDPISEATILDLMMPEYSMPSEKSAERAKQLFPKLRLRDSPKIVTNIEIKDYHKTLKNSVPAATSINVREQIENSMCDDKEMVLDSVLKILNLKLECKVLPNQGSEYVYSCTVNNSPVISDIGLGKTLREARAQAISNMLSSINLLLK